MSEAATEALPAAPKKERSPAQVAAFKRARQRAYELRKERAEKAAAPPTPPPPPPPEEEDEEEVVEEVRVEAPKKKKKKRRVVVVQQPDSTSEESEVEIVMPKLHRQKKHQPEPQTPRTSQSDPYAYLYRMV